MRKVKHYGLRPGHRDIRDKVWLIPSSMVPGQLPPSTNNRASNCPSILDQGQAGTCTANASARMLKSILMKENLPVFDPSRLMIYYNSGLIEGDQDQDNGREVRDMP